MTVYQAHAKGLIQIGLNPLGPSSAMTLLLTKDI